AALAAGLVGVLPRASEVPPADGESDGGGGYPARVERAWFVRDLPDRPGPLSAVIGANLRWYAVSPEGNLWRVPQSDPIDDFPPALSADGRMIGYLAGHTTYVLRDLTSGEETSFPEMTDGAETRADEGTWWLGGQNPGFWSPDGSRLLLRAHRWDDDRQVAYDLVLGTDGSTMEVREEGYPVGWLDDDTLAWLSIGRAGVALEATDLEGAVERRVPIDLPGSRMSQWSAALSPDRSRVALALSNSTGSLVTVSLSDGRVLTREHVGAPDSCPPAWAGEDPVFVQGTGAVSLDTAHGRQVMRVDAGLETTCVLVAADALSGERHRGVGATLLGVGNAWLYWHRQWALLGLAGASLAGAGAAVLARRRRRAGASRA
ncbi:hypothetical protein, partial [Nocardioides sp.]|uniref:hypothetical protein n=1 Tax=Nocardioides sp. TaxID=35761 RepID=UPI002ED935F9